MTTALKLIGAAFLILTTVELFSIRDDEPKLSRWGAYYYDAFMIGALALAFWLLGFGQ